MLTDLLLELSSARGIFGTLPFCEGLARNSYLLNTFLRLKMPLEFFPLPATFYVSLDSAGSNVELLRLF